MRAPAYAWGAYFYCPRKPEKGAFFTGAGAAQLALMAVYLLFSFSLIALLSLALPILFIVGAMMNNNAMRASGPAEPAK